MRSISLLKIGIVVCVSTVLIMESTSVFNLTSFTSHYKETILKATEMATYVGDTASYVYLLQSHFSDEGDPSVDAELAAWRQSSHTILQRTVDRMSLLQDQLFLNTSSQVNVDHVSRDVVHNLRKYQPEAFELGTPSNGTLNVTLSFTLPLDLWLSSNLFIDLTRTLSSQPAAAHLNPTYQQMSTQRFVIENGIRVMQPALLDLADAYSDLQDKLVNDMLVKDMYFSITLEVMILLFGVGLFLPILVSVNRKRTDTLRLLLTMARDDLALLSRQCNISIGSLDAINEEDDNNIDMDDDSLATRGSAIHDRKSKYERKAMVKTNSRLLKIINVHNSSYHKWALSFIAVGIAAIFAIEYLSVSQMAQSNANASIAGRILVHATTINALAIGSTGNPAVRHDTRRVIAEDLANEAMKLIETSSFIVSSARSLHEDVKQKLFESRCLMSEPMLYFDEDSTDIQNIRDNDYSVSSIHDLLPSSQYCSPSNGSYLDAYRGLADHIDYLSFNALLLSLSVREAEVCGAPGFNDEHFDFIRESTLIDTRAGVQSLYRLISLHVNNDIDTLFGIQVIVVFAVMIGAISVSLFIFTPLVRELMREAGHTADMMLMVPSNVVDKSPALQEFLETGHVRDERSLEKDLERLKVHGDALLGATTDCVFMLDSAGTIEKVNHVATSLLLYEENDLIGSLFCKLAKPMHTDRKRGPSISATPRHALSVRDHKEMFFLDFLKGDDDVDNRVLVTAKNDAQIPMQLCVTEVVLSDNNRSFIACLTDIRDIVKREEDVARAQESEYEMIKIANAQKQRTDDILAAMMPADILAAVKAGQAIPPTAYDNVTIFFSDIVGFTSMSSTKSAEVMQDTISRMWETFDALCETRGVVKVETIGDAFFCVCGCPTECPDHAERAAMFALDVQQKMKSFATSDGTPVQIRIGLHTGKVVTGVLGVLVPHWSVVGESVTIAELMQTTGNAEMIHVSDATKMILEKCQTPDSMPTFSFTDADEVQIEVGVVSSVYHNQTSADKSNKIKTYYLTGVEC